MHNSLILRMLPVPEHSRAWLLHLEHCAKVQTSKRAYGQFDGGLRYPKEEDQEAMRIYQPVHFKQR